MCTMLDNIAISVLKKPLDETNKWRVSYLSGLSFAENKRGFPSSLLTEPIILSAMTSKQQHRLLHTWHGKVLRSCNIPIRTFKSQRSIKMELEQNPTFTNRLKKWLGLSSTLQTVRIVHLIVSRAMINHCSCFIIAEHGTRYQENRLREAEAHFREYRERREESKNCFRRGLRDRISAANARPDIDGEDSTENNTVHYRIFHYDLSNSVLPYV